MADEELEAGPDQAEVEKEAALYNWAPKDKWKGDPDKWVDAEEFLKHRTVITDVLRAKNRELHTQVNEATSRTVQLEGKLTAIEATLKTLQATQEQDALERIKAARTELAVQLKEARDAGDTEKEIELLDTRQELADAEKAAKERKPAAEGSSSAKTEPPAWHPKLAAVMGKYKSHLEDEDAMAEALGRGNLLQLRGVKGEAFVEQMAEYLDGKYGGKPVNKTEGTSHSRRASSGGKGYASLPADAKAACDAQTKMVVGPNRAHKDAASWQASYAKQYFDMQGAGK